MALVMGFCTSTVPFQYLQTLRDKIKPIREKSSEAKKKTTFDV